MKKLLFLSIIALFTVASANVFGQSTGTAPSPGAKHNYSVITHSGSTFLWSVTKGGLSVDAAGAATIASTTTIATDITWATGLTVGDWYYVHIVERNGTCSNEKVLPVQITANPFNLAITAANSTSCYNSAVTVSLNGTDVQYNHGATTIVFTVTPYNFSNSYAGYSFDLSLGVPALYTTTVPTFSAGATITAGKVTVTNNSPVTITYTVTNTNVYTNLTDATGNAADFTATATISAGKTINGISDNGTGSKTGATAVSRPNTSGISSN